MKKDKITLDFGEINQLSSVVGKISSQDISSDQGHNLFMKVVDFKVALKKKCREYFEHLEQIAEDCKLQISQSGGLIVPPGTNNAQLTHFDKACKELQRRKFEFDKDFVVFIKRDQLEMITKKMDVEDVAVIKEFMVIEEE